MALTVNATYAGAVSDIVFKGKGISDLDTTQPGRRTDIQRIGWLISSTNVAHLCYYDPVTDSITYEDQSGETAPSIGHE